MSKQIESDECKGCKILLEDVGAFIYLKGKQYCQKCFDKRILNN